MTVGMPGLPFGIENVADAALEFMLYKFAFSSGQFSGHPG
jgi:hypothetical protein